MVDTSGFHAVQTSPLFGTSKFDGHFSPQPRPFRWQVNSFLTAHQWLNQTDMWRPCEGSFFFFLQWITTTRGNFIPPTKQECGKSLGNLEPVYDPFPTSSEFTLPTAVMTQAWCFEEQVDFLTVNHHGPLPLKGLTKHECGETLGDLEPVYDTFPISSEFALSQAVTQTCMRRLCGTGSVEKVVTFTMTHRGTLMSKEVNRWNSILEKPCWGWGIFAYSRPVSDH